MSGRKADASTLGWSRGLCAHAVSWGQRQRVRTERVEGESQVSELEGMAVSNGESDGTSDGRVCPRGQLWV